MLLILVAKYFAKSVTAGQEMNWYMGTRENGDRIPRCVLLANKSDLVEKRAVSATFSEDAKKRFLEDPIDLKIPWVGVEALEWARLHDIDVGGPCETK